MRSKRTDINFSALWFGDKPFVDSSGNMNIIGGVLTTATSETNAVTPMQGATGVAITTGLPINPRGYGSIAFADNTMLSFDTNSVDLGTLNWSLNYETDSNFMKPASSNVLIRVPTFSGMALPANWTAVVQVDVSLLVQSVRGFGNEDPGFYTSDMCGMDLMNVTQDALVCRRTMSFSQVDNSELAEATDSFDMHVTTVCNPGDELTLLFTKQSSSQQEYKVMLQGLGFANTLDAKIIAILPVIEP